MARFSPFDEGRMTNRPGSSGRQLGQQYWPTLPLPNS